MKGDLKQVSLNKEILTKFTDKKEQIPKAESNKENERKQDHEIKLIKKSPKLRKKALPFLKTDHINKFFYEKKPKSMKEIHIKPPSISKYSLNI